jgi:ATP-dependent RNA helicase DeaD
MQSDFEGFTLPQHFRDIFMEMGFGSTNSFQCELIEAIQLRQNLCVIAPSGSQKTSLSLMVLVQQLLSNLKLGTIQLLVVCTDEQHVRQIAAFMQRLLGDSGCEVVMLYNSSDASLFNMRKQALAKGPAIVLGSADRILVHLRLGNAMLTKLDYLVLADTDRLIDKGCAEDLVKLNGFLSGNEQVLLLSSAKRSGIEALIQQSSSNLPWKEITQKAVS